MSDEVYDELVFEGAMANAAQYDRERVIGLYSFSKTYSMTGWRVGYAACPRPLAQLLGTLQEPMISCISGVSQYAALAALEGPQDWIARNREIYRARRDLVGDLLADGGFDAVHPAGAFYQMVPLAPGHGQPAGRPRPRRARGCHGAGKRVRRGRRRPAAAVARRIGVRPARRDRANRRLGRGDGGRGLAGRGDDVSSVDGIAPPDAVAAAVTAVRLTSIHKCFGSNEVLKGVDLVVSPGEHVVVFGPSGSGKSTLLRTINLLERPTSGSVLRVRHRVRARCRRRAGALARRGTAIELRRQVGMVFQQFNLFPHLSALDNVAIGAAARQVDGQDATRASAPPSSCARSACSTTPASTPTSSPEASSSASPSPGRWRWTPR